MTLSLKLAQTSLLAVGTAGALSNFRTETISRADIASPQPTPTVDLATPVSTVRIPIATPAPPPPFELEPRTLEPEPEPGPEPGPESGGTLEPSRGEQLFHREWTAEEGLGSPLFNASSCVACHNDPAPGGAGGLEHNVVPHGDIDAPSIQRYLAGFDRLERIDASRRARLARRLQRHLERTKAKAHKAEHAPPGLQTPSLFGAGLIDRIPDDEILRHADPFDRNRDGIRGIASEVEIEIEADTQCEPGPMATVIGRFGWDASVPHLADFVALALGGETGLTVPQQVGAFGLKQDLDDVADPEVDRPSLDALVQFVTDLPAPVRKGRAWHAEVKLGEELFHSIGCAACHIPELRTVDDEPVPLYSDLLLHTATSDASPKPRRKSLRTPPLWGVGETAPYLHDGRAATLHEAILAHNHEAKRARDTFASLLEYDAGAVVAFLKDL